MVPRLEQKILIFGFTVSQGMILVGLAFMVLMFFKTIMGWLGFFGALVLCTTLVGIPAIVFKFTHAIPEDYLENAIHYYFIKPDIYLPGKEKKGTP